MFKKMDVRKIRVEEDPPAALATQTSENPDPSGGSSGSSSTLSPNPYSYNPSSNGDTEFETNTTYREGPLYPDGHGNVKCSHCSLLMGAICQVSEQRMSGIALLKACEYFIVQKGEPFVTHGKLLKQNPVC